MFSLVSVSLTRTILTAKSWVYIWLTRFIRVTFAASTAAFDAASCVPSFRPGPSRPRSWCRSAGRVGRSAGRRLTAGLAGAVGDLLLSGDGLLRDGALWGPSRPCAPAWAGSASRRGRGCRRRRTPGRCRAAVAAEDAGVETERRHVEADGRLAVGAGAGVRADLGVLGLELGSRTGDSLTTKSMRSPLGAGMEMSVPARLCPPWVHGAAAKPEHQRRACTPDRRRAHQALCPFFCAFDRSPVADPATRAPVPVRRTQSQRGQRDKSSAATAAHAPLVRG